MRGPSQEAVIRLAIVLVAAIPLSGCFEVVANVYDDTVAPGDKVTFVATVKAKADGYYNPIAWVFIEVPESWTFDYAGKTGYCDDPRSNSGCRYQEYTALWEDHPETFCADGMTPEFTPATPRPGYKIYTQPSGPGVPMYGGAWTTIRVDFITDGSPGEYTVRAWGGNSQDNPATDGYPSCSPVFEFPISVSYPLFEDGFESGNTSEWSTTVP